MTVHSGNVKRKKRIYRGALAGVFAAALAFPLAATTAASANPANPRVVLQGSVDCSQFGSSFEPTRIAVSSAAGSASRVINAAPGQTTADYNQLVVSNVPAGPGVPATATLTCTNTENGRVTTIVENFTLARPAGNTVLFPLDVF